MCTFKYLNLRKKSTLNFKIVGYSERRLNILLVNSVRVFLATTVLSEVADFRTNNGSLFLPLSRMGSSCPASRVSVARMRLDGRVKGLIRRKTPSRRGTWYTRPWQFVGELESRCDADDSFYSRSRTPNKICIARLSFSFEFYFTLVFFPSRFSSSSTSSVDNWLRSGCRVAKNSV